MRAALRRHLAAALIYLGRLSFVIAVLYTLTLLAVLPYIAASVQHDHRFEALALAEGTAKIWAWVTAGGLHLPFLLLFVILGLSLKSRSALRATMGMLVVSAALAVFFSAAFSTSHAGWILALLSWLPAASLLLCALALKTLKAEEPPEGPRKRRPASQLGAFLWAMQAVITLLTTLLSVGLIIGAGGLLDYSLMDDSYDALSQGFEFNYARTVFHDGLFYSFLYFPVYSSTAALWVSVLKRSHRHSAATMTALSLAWAILLYLFRLTSSDQTSHPAVPAALCFLFFGISWLLLPAPEPTEDGPQTPLPER